MMRREAGRERWVLVKLGGDRGTQHGWQEDRWLLHLHSLVGGTGSPGLGGSAAPGVCDGGLERQAGDCHLVSSRDLRGRTDSERFCALSLGQSVHGVWVAQAPG